MYLARASTLLAVTLALAACDGDPSLTLPNSKGKGDSATMRLKLTDSSPVANLTIGCDQATGCEGFVEVRILAPEACAFFPDEARCGIGKLQPMAREVAAVTVDSTPEGERRLPLTVETGDGDFFTTSIAAGFSAEGFSELDVLIEKAADAPDLRIEVRAEWSAAVAPGVDTAELEAFLAGVPGLFFTEIGTQYPGYRAYSLSYEQPLDHRAPAEGGFTQQMVLHHRDRAAPMVLHTSGYSLFSSDSLSELAESLPANQISTEQRFFGSSRPFPLEPAMWQDVTIEQAANDHHRIVEALRPFYDGSWLSTGHSKGGMTSIFHRRFFPGDIDATVAYVAPISFANPDPRYVPFLDTIGDDDCRQAVRRVQRTALERFDELLPLAEQDAAGFGGLTFERAGGQPVAFAKAIEQLEWVFWQHAGVDSCDPFRALPTDAAGLYGLVTTWVGIGADDSGFEPWETYHYQAETQLGLQEFATSNLDGVRRFADATIDISPVGTDPVHDPAHMIDVQDWVVNRASQVLFLYGEYDPWTGGAYQVGGQADIVKLTAPKANHGGALIRTLDDGDRALALDTIEQWIGVRPGLGEPRGAPRPAMPLHF